MAPDGYIPTGPGVAAAVGSLIYWLALWEYLRGGGWRPDRSHLFGPAQMPAIREAATRITEIPPLELLQQGMPTPVPLEPQPGTLELP